MYKIGLIGSDNSHGLTFAKLLNFPDKDGEYLADMRITAVYGPVQSENEAVARDGGLITIVDKPEDLIGTVDAVMVIFRHGNLHARYALPFIEAGIPVWIDKPFTLTVTDAEALVSAARRTGTLLMGGTSLIYADGVAELMAAFEDKTLGKIRSGYLNYTADVNSIYGGLFFYGTHIVEVMLRVFGYNPKSAVSVYNGADVVSVVNYDNFNVVINFASGVRFAVGMVHGTNGTFTKEIDSNSGEPYKPLLKDIYKALEIKTAPAPLDNHIALVKTLNAITRSMYERREVFLAEY